MKATISKACSVEGCAKPARSGVNAYCNQHYMQIWRKGKLLPVSREKRFWSLVEKTAACWLWRGGLTDKGYGRFRARLSSGVTDYAHCYAYELLIGPVQEGLELDHLCRTPRCVNPDHLEPVTHRVNVLRGSAPPARQAKQTHCKRGHALEGSNLYLLGHKRTCRICRRMHDRARDARSPNRKSKGRKSDGSKNNQRAA